MSGMTAVATEAERTIMITREFDAPRDLVWDAWTDPKHIEAWWGPRGFTTTVTELDLRPGGRSRYVMRGPDGTEYPVTGVFREVVPKERIVSTDEFDEGFAEVAVGIDLPRGMILTATFESLGPERSRLTLHILHPTIEDRRKHEKMGVVGGWQSSFDCLEDLLEQSTTGAPPTFAIDLPSDIEIRMTRIFHTPRERVFEAFSRPEHLARWWGPDGASTEVIEHDFRPGGEWRFLTRMKDGSTHPFRGEFRAIRAPERIEQTFVYDVDGIRDHPAIETLELSESGGVTTMTATIRHATRESRDGHLMSGMETGARQSYRRLEKLLGTGRRG